MTPNSTESIAQLEVWAWKEKASEAIKDLPPNEWIPAILRHSQPLADEIRAIIAERNERLARQTAPTGLLTL